MMNISILTPEQAKQARSSLCFSQQKVSDAIGIHRTKLALFEVKKYILSNQEEIALKTYFETFDYDFSHQPPPHSKTIAGISISGELSKEEAKQILSMIEQNDSFIHSKANKLTGSHWFTGEIKTESSNQILGRLAHNYLLICLLRGKQLPINNIPMATEPDETTNEMVVSQIIFGECSEEPPCIKPLKDNP